MTIYQKLRENLPSLLRNVERMLIDRCGGDVVVAGRQAEHMPDWELIAWLSDPRIHVKGWWKGSAGQAAALNPEVAAGQVPDRKRPRSSEDDEQGPLRKERKLDATSSGPEPPDESGQIHISHVPSQRPYELPKATIDQADLERWRHMQYSLPKKLKWVPAEKQQVSRSIMNVIRSAWHYATEEIRRCRCSVCVRHMQRELLEEQKRAAEKAALREMDRIKKEQLAQLKMLVSTQLEKRPGLATPLTTDEPDDLLANENYLDELTCMDDTDYDQDSYSDELDEET
jgi:hypothetical protein